MERTILVRSLALHRRYNLTQTADGPGGPGGIDRGLRELIVRDADEDESDEREEARDPVRSEREQSQDPSGERESPHLPPDRHDAADQSEGGEDCDNRAADEEDRPEGRPEE